MKDAAPGVEGEGRVLGEGGGRGACRGRVSGENGEGSCRTPRRGRPEGAGRQQEPAGAAAKRTHGVSPSRSSGSASSCSYRRLAYTVPSPPCPCFIVHSMGD